MYFVGIDAGGTKTDFLLCDENENQIKKVTLSGGNPNDIGIDACISLLASGLDKLCGDIVPDGVFAGVSGGGYGENAEKINEFLRMRFPTSRVANGTDALNIIHCSKSKGNVGALICGTGNVLFLRIEKELIRFGGWGHLFDNGGSAYDIGRDAIRFMLESEQKSSDLNSTLYILLQKKLGASALESLSSIYSQGSNVKSYVASFAPLVFEAYEQGDLSASNIIKSNVSAVSSAIQAAFAHVKIEAVDEIICAGGLFNSDIFYSLLSKEVNAPLMLLSVPPVLGACRLAMIK